MKAKKIWLIVKEDTNNESAMLGEFAYDSKEKAKTIFDYIYEELGRSLPPYLIRKNISPYCIEWYDKNGERKVQLYMCELTLLEE